MLDPSLAMSDRAILTSALITLGCTTAASVLPESVGGKGELPSPKLYVGTGVAYFGISTLSQGAPKVAQYLSVAIALTAFIAYGSPLLANWFAGQIVQPVAVPTTPTRE